MKQHTDMRRRATTAESRSGQNGAPPSITVVVPCYNEEAVLRISYAELDSCLRNENVSLTFLFVDDGSSDGTWSILLDLKGADPRVRLIRLSRNFGHQAALKAGIDYAAGDAVVVIDADLQDPPEIIGRFLAYWRSGFDIVYGRRTKRYGESTVRRLLTTAFYALANSITTIRLEPEVGDFYLLDRRVVSELRKCCEHRPFLRGVVQWLGFSRKAVEYERRPRSAGISKYTWRRLYGLAADGLSSFCINLFPVVVAVAASWFLLAAVAFVAALVLKLFLEAALAAIFCGQAVVLMAVAVIGQFVWGSYNNGCRRPTYLLDSLDPAYQASGKCDNNVAFMKPAELQCEGCGFADE